jgi:hypothetical protein
MCSEQRGWSMKAREAHILWTPADYKRRLLRRGGHPPGSVKVLRFLSEADRQEAQRYKRDTGASLTDWRHRSSEQLKALVLAEFHTLVVRDGMHPQAVHQAFLVIDEYREVISPDIRGSKGGANLKELHQR